jgi:hypothetical protein
MTLAFALILTAALLVWGVGWSGGTAPPSWPSPFPVRWTPAPSQTARVVVRTVVVTATATRRPTLAPAIEWVPPTSTPSGAHGAVQVGGLP